MDKKVVKSKSGFKLNRTLIDQRFIEKFSKKLTGQEFKNFTGLSVVTLVMYSKLLPSLVTTLVFLMESLDLTFDELVVPVGKKAKK